MLCASHRKFILFEMKAQIEDGILQTPTNYHVSRIIIKTCERPRCRENAVWRPLWRPFKSCTVDDGMDMGQGNATPIVISDRPQVTNKIFGFDKMLSNLLSLTLEAKSEINVNNSITRAVSHMISSSVADDNDDDIYI